MTVQAGRDIQKVRRERSQRVVLCSSKPARLQFERGRDEKGDGVCQASPPRVDRPRFQEASRARSRGRLL